VNDLLPQPQQVELLNGAMKFEPRDLNFILKNPFARSRHAHGGAAERSAGSPGHAANRPHECPIKDTFALIVFVGETPPVAPEFQGRHKKDAAETPGMEAEGYELSVSDKGVAITAAGEHGLFYGMMTLEQLLASARAHRLDSLPCLHMLDLAEAGHARISRGLWPRSVADG